MWVAASSPDTNYVLAEGATIEMIVSRSRIRKRMHGIYDGMQLELLKLSRHIFERVSRTNGDSSQNDLFQQQRKK
jgi:hypothetical protein